MSFAIGDRVRLIRTGNERVEGREATIAALEDWGAHCRTEATTTGRYRAVWDEMERLGSTDHAFVEAEADAYRASVNGNGQVKPHQGVPPVLVTEGVVCATCGSLDMMRSGTCYTCLSCGSTSGCS
jgi:hypothetical protein